MADSPASGFVEMEVRVVDGMLVWPPFTISGTPEAAGSELKSYLQGTLAGKILEDHHIVEIEATSAASIEVIVSDIVMPQSHLDLTFIGICLTADASFDSIVQINGTDNYIEGLKVDGSPSDSAPLTGGDRGKGIFVLGDRNELNLCEASNLPPGVHAHCIEVRGRESLVVGCKAKNPGYSCFQCRTPLATFDNIEAFIDRPAVMFDQGASFQNRLFNISTVPAEANSRVEIRNSEFRSEFVNDPKITNSMREVTIVFTPGKQIDGLGLVHLEMTDCEIDLGTNALQGPNKHVIKLNNVEDTVFENVTLTTPAGFNGKAITFSKSQGVGKFEAALKDCDFDQGFGCIGNNTIARISLENCDMGSATSFGTALFSSWEQVLLTEIKDCDFLHSNIFMKFNVEDVHDQLHVSLENVDFKSDVFLGTSSVFWSAPRRSSFLTAVNFTYDTINSSLPDCTLNLAPGAAQRLAATSNGSQPNTMLYNPDHSGRCSVPGPPFDMGANTNEVIGARIYLAPGTTPPSSWLNADYWEWDGTQWNGIKN